MVRKNLRGKKISESWKFKEHIPGIGFNSTEVRGDPNLAPPLHRKIWKTLDETDDVASKYSQFKNYLPNMEVTDLKMRYWRFFNYKIFEMEKIGFFSILSKLSLRFVSLGAN